MCVGGFDWLRGNDSISMRCQSTKNVKRFVVFVMIGNVHVYV